MAEITLGRLSAESAAGSAANPDEDDQLFDVDDDAADEALEKEALEHFQEHLHGEDYRAVVFVDLLGFSDLTLKWPVIEAEFRVLDRPNKEDFLRVRLESVGNNRLIEAYMHFTMALDEVIEYQLLCDNPIRSITFSDSAFIATERVEDAVGIANDIWSRLTRAGIPVRCGVAYGTFVIIRFRSDLSLRADTHAAQFVGTGVVWAHAACERSGLKGLRVFIHPSAAKRLGPLTFGEPPMLASHIMALAPDEHSEHVAIEGRPLFPKPHRKLKDILHREYWRLVQIMHEEAIVGGAHERILAHYTTTFAMLNRMRADSGWPPLHPLEQFPLEDRPDILGIRAAKRAYRDALRSTRVEKSRD